MMLSMLVNDTTGMAAMLTGAAGTVDFGQRTRDAVKELEAVVPSKHMIAGMKP